MYDLGTLYSHCSFFCSVYILLISFLLFLVLRKDPNYEATRLHFENLAKRYGNPILILNLIKVGLSAFIEK